MFGTQARIDRAQIALIEHRLELGERVLDLAMIELGDPGVNPARRSGAMSMSSDRSARSSVISTSSVVRGTP
jgi:hypothetical protein